MQGFFVLDACALLALVKKEEGSNIVANAVIKATSGDICLCMNRINLLEVYYGFYRDNGKDYALNILEKAEASVIKIVEFDREILLEAGRLKATYKLSLADCIAVAQAIVLKGSLLTADHHELDALDGKENIRFTWIR